MSRPLAPRLLEGRPGIALRNTFPLWRLLGYILLILWILSLPYLALLVGLSGPLSLPFLGQVLVCIGAALLCIWWLFRRPAREFWHLWQLKSGRLWFSQEPLRAGLPLHLEYQRTLRQPLPRDGWVLARLTCASVSVVRDIDSADYNPTVLWQQTFDPAPLYAGQTTLVAHWNTQLPAELPASHSRRNRLVVWQLELREEVPDFVSVASDYVLPVEGAGF